MKKFNSTKIAFALFATMTTASVTGVIGSTLAWYAFSSRALASYSGTSVSETTLLQIGICSDERITNLVGNENIAEVTYEEDFIPQTSKYSKYYYFAYPGRGMTYDVIAEYLTLKGFATNELEPLTSGSYSTGNDQDDFALKQSPNELVHGNTIEALKKDYLTIPFVFRVQTGAENSNSFVDGTELWLSKALARASDSGQGQVYKAIRMFVDRDEKTYDWIKTPDIIKTGTEDPEGNLDCTYYAKTSDSVDDVIYVYENGVWNTFDVDVKETAPDESIYNVGDYYYNSTEKSFYVKPQHKDFIVNPSAENKGKTRVGGLLNRMRDDYFDYDSNGEILYGEFDNSALSLMSTDGYNPASQGDTVYDVNGVGIQDPSNEDINTFVAKHYPNTRYYDREDIFGQDSLFGHAEFESISSITPARDNRDRLTNQDPLDPTSVCITRADDHHLGRVNITVYLEGWDFSVVDAERNHSFDLGLTFEISR